MDIVQICCRRISCHRDIVITACKHGGSLVECSLSIIFMKIHNIVDNKRISEYIFIMQRNFLKT